MKRVVFSLPGNEAIAQSLAGQLEADLGLCQIRHFPDGESYVRIETPVEDREAILVCTLDRPDEKFLPLQFMAATARELGASRVGLVCPYLAYMRQDQRFRAGEAVSSLYFAGLLNAMADWLVAVDPHLHRRDSLDGVFSIPAVAVHAAPCVASWIRDNVPEPVLIGPDNETAQWVASVAAGAGAPYVVLEKIRSGDRAVEVSVPDISVITGRTPVLVDDIISTGRTMIAAMTHLAALRQRPPVCVGVHAIFAGDAYGALSSAGAAQIVTCNTVVHESNAIDVASPIAAAVSGVIAMVDRPGDRNRVQRTS